MAESEAANTALTTTEDGSGAGTVSAGSASPQAGILQAGILQAGIPQDPVILLSFLNMKLRDFYPSLDELCASLAIEKEAVVEKLRQINYEYDAERNQFA